MVLYILDGDLFNSALPAHRWRLPFLMRFKLASLPSRCKLKSLSWNSHPTLIVIRQRIQIEQTFVLMIIMTPMNNGLTNKGKGIFQSSWNFPLLLRQTGF